MANGPAVASRIRSDVREKVDGNLKQRSNAGTTPSIVLTPSLHTHQNEALLNDHRAPPTYILIPLLSPVVDTDTIPSSKPFKKLQAQDGMSSKAKVGSWLGDGAGAAKKDANESDSESSAASVVSDIEEPPKANEVDELDDDDDELQTPDESSRELNIDWEVVLPKVRPALLDRSGKRREQFAARFLYVTDEGTLFVIVHQNKADVPKLRLRLRSLLFFLPSSSH